MSKSYPPVRPSPRGFKLSGKLHAADFKAFVPAIAKLDDAWKLLKEGR